MTHSTSPQRRSDRLTIRYDYLAEGYQPYPQDGHRTHSIAKALAEPIDTFIIVCGRIRAMRVHGTTQHIDIDDESGSIRIVMTKNDTENFDKLRDLDLGDFVRVQGLRYLAPNNEHGLLAGCYDMLTKALLTPPDNAAGLANGKEHDHPRHLELITNNDLREIFRQRSRINASIRHTLETEGFLNADTPMLQPFSGGTTTNPFIANSDAFGGKAMYLKKSNESYLKRFVVGGLEKVYSIDKTFQNEDINTQDQPEVTMLECYSAYEDYKDMLRLTQHLYRNAAIAATGSDIVPYDLIRQDAKGGTRRKRVELNFRDPWECLTMVEAIQECLGIDVTALTDAELQQAIGEVKGIEVDVDDMKYKPFIRGLKIVELFQVVEPNFIQPTFIIDFPRDANAFCKRHRTVSGLVERLDIYMMGMKVGNAYTELNDPVLQRDFMEDERGDKTHAIDEDLIEALEYGMPPTAGLRLNVDQMVTFLTNSRSVQDVMLFPITKPRR